MPSVAILGASGYTGMELIRLLLCHPEFEVVVATSEQHKGERLTAHLVTHGDLPERYCSLSESISAIAECDLVFSALPHGEAAKVLPRLTSDAIIDLSGDFRLSDPSLYPHWYHFNHPSPSELGRWTYGLPEFFRGEIVTSRRIANPGCYATAALLAAIPLCQAGLIEGPIVLVGASGTSGAGRGSKAELHFSHVYEDMRPYKVASHQHVPEIEANILKASGQSFPVTFVPQLAPMVRGILMTCVAHRKGETTAKDVQECLRSAYGNEHFVTVLDEPSGTKSVRGANGALLFGTVDERTGQVIVTSVIDNLVKGASGQAVQNANLVFGYSEMLGLEGIHFYP